MAFLPYKETQLLFTEIAFYIKDMIQRNNLRHWCGLLKRGRMDNWQVIKVSVDQEAWSIENGLVFRSRNNGEIRQKGIGKEFTMRASGLNWWMNDKGLEVGIFTFIHRRTKCLEWMGFRLLIRFGSIVCPHKAVYKKTEGWIWCETHPEWRTTQYER